MGCHSSVFHFQRAVSSRALLGFGKMMDCSWRNEMMKWSLWLFLCSPLRFIFPGDNPMLHSFTGLNWPLRMDFCFLFSVLAVALKMTTTRKRLPWSTRSTSKCFLADLSKSVRLCRRWPCHGYRCNRCYTPLLISPVPQCLWCLGVLVLISASGTLSCMVLKTLTWYSPALTGTARWAAACWVGFTLPLKCIHPFWLRWSLEKGSIQYNKCIRGFFREQKPGWHLSNITTIITICFKT